MVKKILIVGCGNIGSRHLQGISKIDRKLEIHVVEPQKKAVLTAKKRLESVKNAKYHSIVWHKEIKTLNQRFDLSIIATNSDIRADIVDHLLKLGNSMFLLEKIVCQSETDYIHLLDELRKHNAKAWVNLPLRYFPFYKDLKKKLSTKPVFMSVLGGDKGLGSNAIHFIDLFTWLCDEEKITLDGNLLFPQIQPNKRGKNFREFSGILSGTIKKSKSAINFNPKIKLPIIINIWNKQGYVTIDETNRMILHSSFLTPRTSFRYVNVSDTTTWIVKDILRNSDCLLPQAKSCFRIHTELFRIFNQHISNISGKTPPSLCPIT